MNGMELCQAFYNECVDGIIALRYPDLRYSAGLLGFGSDVLGYDDKVSQDHMWGPRLYIFLARDERMDPDRLMKTFCEDLPRRFRGFPVGFGQADEHGISSMEDTESAFRPMINISTFDDFMNKNLGVADVDQIGLFH